jgi:hypothetical protein
MRKVLKVLLVSMVLAGVLATALAVTVAAAGPQGNGTGSVQTGSSTIDVVSKLLGLTPEQIQEQRQAGKSLLQIAATKNVTEVALVDAIMADKEAAVQKLVTAGTITQEQADLRLAQMRERVELAVNRTATGRPEWAAGNGNGQNGVCNGTGVMRQSNGQGNQENCTGTPGTCTGSGKMMRAGRASK